MSLNWENQCIGAGIALLVPNNIVIMSARFARCGFSRKTRGGASLSFFLSAAFGRFDFQQQLAAAA
jgi:hypothetical protein